MPLLMIGSKEVVHYEKEWLQEAISRAALEAGHEGWWFAEDVAKGMILYLQKRFRRNTITLQELFDKISKTLTTIGFQDVADKLVPTPPPLRISLIDLAREAGSGYELVFFELLRQQLLEARNFGAEQIHFSELKRCVKHLRGTKRWGKDCDLLEREIVHFVQERADKDVAVSQLSLVMQ